jgi:uncharacterized protein
VRGVDSTAIRERPTLNPDVAPFWAGVQRGVLLIQQCSACGALRFPWGPACPACGELAWSAVESSGRGTVYSYVTVHHPLPSPFREPFTTGLIQLEEGVRIVGLLHGVDPAEVAIGAAAEVVFTADGDFTFADFRIAGGAKAGT